VKLYSKPDYSVKTHLARRDYVDGQLVGIMMACLVDRRGDTLYAGTGVTERAAIEDLNRELLSTHAAQQAALQRALNDEGTK